MRDKIKKILRCSGYPDRAEFEWADFEKAYQDYLRTPLPTHESLPNLACLFGRSFYLSNRLIQDPVIAKRFFESPYRLQAKPYARFLAELLDRLEPHTTDLLAAAKILRQYRYEEMIRLTVRELSGLANFVELGEERSDLAAACTEAAYRMIHKDLTASCGIPQNPENDRPAEFSVFGMGKLGGSDLNHSSDIDLIYFYSSDEGRFKNKPSQETLSPHQYFVRLSEKLTALLHDRTEDGFVYRVDLDLRPEGKKGTLANSLDAMEVYYEYFGGNWERMAMIKARPVAGSKALAELLIDRLAPFVYPRHSDYSILQQLRDLKQRIEQSLRDRVIGGVDPQAPGYNVKLGVGGIREVEFFVGAFQRLYGGRDPELKERHTLGVIERLTDKKIISHEEGQKLDLAYRFLRRVENQLQMLEERQTHSLPKAKDEMTALAVNLADPAKGFANRDEAVDVFRNQLLIHTEHVRFCFDKLLEHS